MTNKKIIVELEEILRENNRLIEIGATSGLLATEAILERKELRDTLKNVAGSLTLFPAGLALYYGIGFGLGYLVREVMK